MEAFPILMLGLNHRGSPVEVRERLAFGPERLGSALQQLLTCGDESIAEAVLLSTCNRTEIYLQASQPAIARRCLQQFMLRHSGLPLEELDRMLYSAQDAAATRHLMQVAAGLDSLIQGENEILGQVRCASDLAHLAGTNGPILTALFQAAVRAGKRARTETPISSQGHSVASVLVGLAAELLGPLADRTALLIGAGKISSLTARALKGAGLHCILVANRTFARAQELAQRLQGQAVHFDALDESLQQADIVICSTGAPHLVLHADTVARAQQARRGRPLLVADLAVPRDADPVIASLPGVRLVNIDALELSLKGATKDAVLTQVEAILDEELAGFVRWCDARRCAPLIRSLSRKAESICQAELQETLRRLGPLTPRQEQLLQGMAKAIAGKLLHEPIACLRDLPHEQDVSSYLELVQDLYRLP